MHATVTTPRPVLHARRAAAVQALAFAAIGAVFFVAPGWSADEFPWRVSHFLAMTMGAWYLGSAVFAWTVLQSNSLGRVHAVLAYLWLFSLGQASLLLIHHDVIRTDALLTWPYVAAVTIAAAASLVELGAAARMGLVPPAEGHPMPWWLTALVAAFVVAVALLALPLIDGYDSPRSIWPGELTLISARAFAVFFGSLSLSSATLLIRRRIEPALPYVRAGIALSAIILVAAAFYLGQFAIGDHPLQLLYIGLYVAVLAGSLALLAYGRRRVGQ